ncbi:MAG: transposase family protein [Proteobacteria bacterium]|nr:transposase family protein [Pseudomonadota bacterium]
MARRTESERLEAANEGVALGHFEEALKGLGDPRRGQGRRYPLRTVIVTALMSMVCGCDDAESMEVGATRTSSGCRRFSRCRTGTRPRMCS